MNEAIIFFLGSLVGIAASWLMFRPDEAFRSGWDEAEKTLTDYVKWFDAGWEEAFKTVRKISDSYCERHKNGNIG